MNHTMHPGHIARDPETVNNDTFPLWAWPLLIAAMAFVLVAEWWTREKDGSADNFNQRKEP